MLTLSNIRRVNATGEFTCAAREDVANGYTSDSSDKVVLNVQCKFKPRFTYKDSSNYEGGMS